MPGTVRVVFLSLVVSFFAAVLCPLAQAQVVAFRQVDYYQDGTMAVPDSEWGQIDVGYQPGPEIQWLNVVADPGGSAEWAVQNFPLYSTAEVGTGSYTAGTYFDLGVSRGVDATSINVGWVVSKDPLLSQPTVFDYTGLESVGASSNVINNGVPSLVATLNPPTTTTTSWSAPGADFTVTVHTGMPNVVQERNFCGPGAATNSLHWLYQGQHPPFGQTPTQTQTELAGNMGNNNDGNWDDTEVSGKLKFIKDHNLDLEVHYTGGVKLPTAGNYADPNGNGTANNNGAFSCDWLVEQMKKGQDIEIMTNTHWVVVSGVIQWGDICLVEFRDDPYQNGAATTAGQAQEIAGRHTWTSYDSSNGKINIGNGEEVLQTAVAESPNPTPVQAPSQGKCINGLNKFGALAANVQGKEDLSCIKLGSAGKLGSQTIAECTTADSKSKLAKVGTKAGLFETAACTPAPDFAATSASTAVQVGSDMKLYLTNAVFGPLDSAIVPRADDKAAAKCQLAVAKVVEKCGDTVLKGYNKCKKRALSGDAAVSSGLELQAACLEFPDIGTGGVPDPKLALPKVCEGQLEKVLGKKCSGQDLSALFPACLATGAPELVGCIGERARCGACLTINSMDGLNRTCDLFDDASGNSTCPVQAVD